MKLIGNDWTPRQIKNLKEYLSENDIKERIVVYGSRIYTQKWDSKKVPRYNKSRWEL